MKGNWLKEGEGGRRRGRAGALCVCNNSTQIMRLFPHIKGPVGVAGDEYGCVARSGTADREAHLLSPPDNAAFV